MGKVGKYNLFKAISTVLTIGAPLITLGCCSEMFVHKSGTAVSAAGMFAILVCLLFAKDKIAENFKMPSAFVFSAVSLVLIIMIEQILLPIKLVCIVTLITSGVDELSFKPLYKSIEMSMPETAKAYKKAGFIFSTSKKLGCAESKQNVEQEGEKE